MIRCSPDKAMMGSEIQRINTELQQIESTNSARMQNMNLTRQHSKSKQLERSMVSCSSHDFSDQVRQQCNYMMQHKLQSMPSYQVVEKQQAKPTAQGPQNDKSNLQIQKQYSIPSQQQKSFQQAVRLQKPLNQVQSIAGEQSDDDDEVEDDDDDGSFKSYDEPYNQTAVITKLNATKNQNAQEIREQCAQQELKKLERRKTPKLQDMEQHLQRYKEQLQK